MMYHGTQQVCFPELTQAVMVSTDPLEIVNWFFKMPLGVEPVDPYWEKRVCALAELIVARNKFRDKPKRRKKRRKVG